MGDGVVYVDGGDEHLAALRVTDGTLLRRSFFGGLASGELLLTERNIFISRGLHLVVLNRQTGRIIRQLNQPGRTYESFIASAAAAKDGQIFINVSGAAWSFDEP